MNYEELLGVLYSNYTEWKKWGGGDYSGIAETFSEEFRRAGWRKGSKLLEVGFGEGLLLDWARESGYDIHGLEINGELVDRARDRDHKVTLGSEDEVSGSYDGVIAFDVVEHLTAPEVYTKLLAWNRLLNRNGRILLRFPNGASPFGRVFQYGDLTHRTVFSASSIDQLAGVTGYKMVRAYNSARTLRSGERGNLFLLKWVAYKLRDLVEIVVGYLYLAGRQPLDPNLTVVLEKVSDI